jgi:hypothetical protein
MALYSEQELKYARPVANAILESQEFRQWLLAGTKHEQDAVSAVPIGSAQGRLRSPNLKNPYWFNYFCGKDAKCACRIGSGIETDILIFLDCGGGRGLGLHIEVKRPGARLGDGQAESYPRRAACWANPETRPRTVWPHQDFLTILICGRELIADERTRYFDKVMCHEDLMRLIPVYPEQ